MNRLNFVLTSMFSFSATVAFAESPVIPEAFPADRYAKMAEDSPFALATAAAPVAEPVKSWAADYYVGGIGKVMVDGKEEQFVAIKSRSAQESFSLFGNEDGHDGISIAGVEWSDSLGKSRVTLKKGAEFATIEFDQAAIQTPIAAPQIPQQRGVPVMPGSPNQPGGARVIRPPTAPNPTPAVPRPTAVPQLPQAQQPNAIPNLPVGSNPANAQQPRGTRIRTIKSTP